jgi:exportin-T
VPVGYTLPPLEVFQQMAQAILVSLEVMKVHRIVRDAVRDLVGTLVVGLR